MVTNQYVSINELRISLIDEIIKSVGLPRTPFWRKVFSPIFWLPTDRFSRFGSNFDKLVAKSGFNKAIKNALTFFVGDVEVHGGDNIPKKGPLLVVSNHPGTYDAVVIAAQLPRDDVRIVSSGIPFIQKMRNANRHYFFCTFNYIRHDRFRAAAFTNLLQSKCFRESDLGNVIEFSSKDNLINDLKELSYALLIPPMFTQPRERIFYIFS